MQKTNRTGCANFPVMNTPSADAKIRPLECNRLSPENRRVHTKEFSAEHITFSIHLGICTVLA
jgi:hypothetical protein